MEHTPKNGAIAAGLLTAVFLWGANNTGVKYIVRFWPPIAVGSTRFIAAGIVLLLLFRWTPWFGRLSSLTPAMKRHLWWRCGLSLAVYITAFNWALRLTSLTHVAIYLGAAPVWALLWEGRPRWDWKSAQRYGAAALAFSGVLLLFLPMLKDTAKPLLGEILGLSASVLWVNFGIQCRALGRDLTGPEISAHSFWRAGVLLAPLAALELTRHAMPLLPGPVLVQIFCVLGGSVAAFALWNHGLRHWKASQVYLFNNLIPLSNMGWAWLCLKEPITRTFWMAMLLIGAGVLLGQTQWDKLLRWAIYE